MCVFEHYTFKMNQITNAISAIATACHFHIKAKVCSARPLQQRSYRHIYQLQFSLFFSFQSAFRQRFCQFNKKWIQIHRHLGTGYIGVNNACEENKSLPNSLGTQPIKQRIQPRPEERFILAIGCHAARPKRKDKV